VVLVLEVVVRLEQALDGRRVAVRGDARLARAQVVHPRRDPHVDERGGRLDRVLHELEERGLHRAAERVVDRRRDGGHVLQRAEDAVRLAVVRERVRRRVEQLRLAVHVHGVERAEHVRDRLRLRHGEVELAYRPLRTERAEVVGVPVRGVVPEREEEFGVHLIWLHVAHVDCCSDK
jgi:hypothetical protein